PVGGTGRDASGTPVPSSRRLFRASRTSSRARRTRSRVSGTSFHVDGPTGPSAERAHMLVDRGCVPAHRDRASPERLHGPAEKTFLSTDGPYRPGARASVRA